MPKAVITPGIHFYQFVLLQKRFYSLGVHKCEWEETFGDLYDRTMAMSRSTVVKTEISPSNLDAHHILDLDTPTHVCQQFGCYNVRYCVTQGSE